MPKMNQIITYVFKEITTKSLYDSAVGCEIININDKVCTVPKKMYDHIRNNPKGYSFTFSAYMIYLLRQSGILSQMIKCDRGGDSISAVLYTDSGQKYVADPSTDIEYFTTHDIDSETRNSMYDLDGTLITDSSRVNSSRIPFDEYKKNFDKVSILDLYQDNDITLQEALNNMKQVR